MCDLEQCDMPPLSHLTLAILASLGARLQILPLLVGDREALN